MKQLLPFVFACWAAVASGQEIVVCSIDGMIYKLDMKDCSTTLLCNLQTNTFDLAFHPNGKVYVLTPSGELIEVDLKTCAFHTVHQFMGQQYNSLVTDANGIFYATGSLGLLWTYDLNLKQETLLGDIGYNASGDLTFNNGVLYMAAQFDRIVEVDTKNLSNSKVVLNLTNTPNVFGVFSYAENCQNTQSYIASENGIYSVDFSDKSVKFICQVPFLVGGGASANEFASSNPVVIQDITQKNPECNQQNGSITVQASGGYGALSYSLDGQNFQPGNQFDQLPAGNYLVYVRDTNACETNKLVKLTTAGAPEIATLKVQNAHCDQDNGSIAFTATGGTGTLLYSLGGQSYSASTVFENLPAGFYTIYVKDEKDCMVSLDTALIQTGTPVIQDILSQNAVCDQDNGVLKVISSGGSGNLRLSLNGAPYQSSVIFDHLAAGTYTVTVQDDSGCTNSEQAALIQMGAPAIQSAQATAAICEKNNGTITAQASGGTGALAFSLDGTSFQASGDFKNLLPGTYTVTVQDANGCTDTESVTIAGTGIVRILAVATTPAHCGLTNGTIEISATSDLPPLRYTIHAGSAQGAPLFAQLRDGSYTITVSDSLGCSADTSVVVKLECDIYVPNVFSPNGDQENDIFRAYSAPGVYEVLNFSVFDRWGDALFARQQFPLDDDNAPWWDGTSRGKDLSAGVYVYLLEVLDQDGEKHLIQGDVTLLR